MAHITHIQSSSFILHKRPGQNIFFISPFHLLSKIKNKIPYWGKIYFSFHLLSKIKNKIPYWGKIYFSFLTCRRRPPPFHLVGGMPPRLRDRGLVQLVSDSAASVPVWHVCGAYVCVCVYLHTHYICVYPSTACLRQRLRRCLAFGVKLMAM